VSLRGGRGYHYNNDPVELNPYYKNYVQPSANEHEVWLQQQQQQQQHQQPQHQTTYGNNDSLSTRTQQYMTNLHQTSPSLFWTTISCIAVFVAWQIPSLAPLLHKLFLCNRSTLRSTGGASLILSAISHNSFYHVLVNLFTLLHIGPTVQQALCNNNKKQQQPIWPLLLGSAVAGNSLFVGARPLGSCMGLSGVTMSLIAVNARLYPQRVFGIVVGVFPVRLPAEHMLQILLIGSLVGSFAKGSRIAHLAHLGGLLFGILYHELYLNNNSSHHVLRKWSSFSRKAPSWQQQRQGWNQQITL
jgi:membrane associated rhomboid family serine protease